MSVTIHEAGFRNLFERPEGPLGRYIEAKGGRVDQLATNNAAGRPGPRIRTSDLINSIHQTSVRKVAGALQTDIVATARHRGFNYPVAQEMGGFTPQGAFYRYRFLEPALATTFNLPLHP